MNKLIRHYERRLLLWLLKRYSVDFAANSRLKVWPASHAQILKSMRELISHLQRDT
jgi:hypothetical protein